MERTIIAVGLIGVFEALLQQHFQVPDGWPEAEKRLNAVGRQDLSDRLKDYRDAINVLKHGTGRSYRDLIARRASLPFSIKGPGEPFHNEGDVAEISPLVAVDTTFIDTCLDLVEEVRTVLELD